MRIAAYIRSCRLLRIGRDNYTTAVLGCEAVSRANNSLCFLVHRTAPFGYPHVELIQRPEVVTMTEAEDCVLVRDGYVYELNKSR